ncbi:DUF2157 domain-containing protein [Halalkalibacillus halophilus]|uniref:DUF2157 domain-containing protein n=1 Tax=Halalkalibacillus halophilus TaxID=392827 RepID=UPI000416BCF4|nr:DUF2157 domain-containing protein [Halalkalibacillus halophilus]
MKKRWLEQESKQWIDDGIINTQQREEILARYQGRSNISLLFFFAAILIGLAVLSVIATNWTDLTEMVRMGIIIFFLIVFNSLGYWLDGRGFKQYGLFCYVVALGIFGAGIFLAFDMYGFPFHAPYGFIAWAIASYLIYLSRPSYTLWLVGVLVVIVGQLNASFSLQEFNWILLGIYIIGFGTSLFYLRKPIDSWIFVAGLMSQLFAYALELEAYYWLTVFALVVYIFSFFIKRNGISQAFRVVAIITVFILTIFHATIYESLPVPDDASVSWVYFVLLGIGIVGAIYLLLRENHKWEMARLIIFLPVFIVPEWSTLLACSMLLSFSLLILIEGFVRNDQRQINIGTFTFLLTILIIYFQVAWEFFDRSLFFLIGGIILFVIGFVLNRQKHKWQQGVDES